jgi:hypothetical protein
VLFNVTLDSAVKASEIRGNGLIYNQLVQVMAYADDIVILTRTKNNLVQALISSGEENGTKP